MCCASATVTPIWSLYNAIINADAAWCAVQAISTVPVLLAVVNMVKPKLVARGTGALFAVVCVLQIFMANLYLDIAKVATPSLELSKGDVDQYAKVALAGFAIMAAAALLTMIFESVMDPNREKKDKSHNNEHDHDHSRDYNKGDYHESRGRRSHDNVGGRATGSRPEAEPHMRPVVVPPVGGVEHGRPVPIAGQRPVLVDANRV